MQKAKCKSQNKKQMQNAEFKNEDHFAFCNLNSEFGSERIPRSLLRGKRANAE
jgi:hypothetical protein